MEDRQQLLFTKTSPDSSPQRTTPLDALSEHSQGAMKPLKLKPGSGLKQAMCVEKPAEWVIESSMPNTSVSLRGVGESFSLPCLVNLSNVLESGSVHQRYFLSEKACSGILRRAASRGKELPQALKQALEAVCSPASTPTSMPSGEATSG
jgi:hypothetical protein